MSRAAPDRPDRGARADEIDVITDGVVADPGTSEAAESASSEVRRLFGRGSIYLVATASQAAGAWLVLPLVTRVLSQREFGTVAACTVVIQLLATLAASGLANPILRGWYQPGGHVEARVVFTVGCALALGWGILAFATGPLWIQVFSSLDFDTPMQLAVVGSTALAVSINGQALWRAQDRVVLFVGGAIVTALGGPALGFVLARSYGVNGYMIGLSLAYVLAGLLAVVTCAPRVRPDPVGSVRRALRIGAPMLPHAMAMYLISAVDRVIVERKLGLDSAGRYQMAYFVGTATLALLGALTNAWAPIVYGASDARRWKVLSGTTSTLVPLCAACGILTMLAAPFLLAFTMPASWDPKSLIPVVAVLSTCVLPVIVYQSRVQVLFQTGRTVVLAWATPAVAVLNVVLTVIMVGWWGLLGAAIATVITYAAQAGLVSWAAADLASVPWQRKVEWATAALLVVGAGGSVLLGGSIAAYGARLVLAAAVIAAAAWWLRRAVDEREGALAP